MFANRLQTSLALLTAFAGGALISQQKSVPAPVWPPHPATDVINVMGQEQFTKRSRDRVIYTVPPDKWLVITDFRREMIDSTVDPDLDLVMQPEKSKRDVVLIPHQLSDNVNLGSAVGLKCPPKSKVILHRNAELSGDLSSLYMLTGYLVEGGDDEE